MKLIAHIRNFGKVGTNLDITARIARLLLLAFVVTFVMARIVVFLIAEQYISNLFLFVKGTHVHHLNYGICLLSLVGLLLLLLRPKASGLYFSTLAYGVGLALTFDEFGMWLTLGGSYNNRLTFDAILIIASLLASIALILTVEHWHPRHWVMAGVVFLLIASLAYLAVMAHRHLGVMDRMFSIEGL